MNVLNLYFDDSIPQLEKENRWYTAAQQVTDKWKSCPANLNYFLCAGTQLWYTLLILECFKCDPYPPKNLETASCFDIEKELAAITRYGFQNFHDNPYFNAYFGYMMSISPQYSFGYINNYLQLEKRGLELMEYAYTLSPDDSLVKAIYYTTEYNKNIFKKTCSELWAQSSAEEKYQSAVQSYFCRILNKPGVC